MNVSNFPVSSQTPRLVIRGHSDLLVQGGDDNIIIFEVDDKSSLSVQQNNDDLRATALDDCRITVPRGATVEVERTGGDLDILNLTGRVVLFQVGGDCEIEDLGAIEIINVGGDLTVARSAGPVNIHHAGGDLECIDITGMLRVDGAGGDVTLKRVSLPSHVAAGGDLDVHMDEAVSGAGHLHAGGDINLNFAGGANVTLVIKSHGDIELDTAAGHKTIETHQARMQLGNGGPELVVNAGGDVSVHDGSGEQARVTEIGQSAGWTHGMEAGLRAAERSARIGQRTAERGMRHAEEVSRHAHERVQAAMQRLDMKLGGQNFPFPTSGMPEETISGMETMGDTEDPSGQASDEERLLILQMVAEKKITIEEAEQLLEALEK